MFKSLAILMFAVGALEAFAGTKINVECKNADNTFSINKKSVVIAQKNLQGNEALKELIKKDFALDVDSVDLKVDIEMVIPAKDLTCQGSASLLVDCQGRSKKAQVTLSASYQQVGGQGSMEFSRRMNLNNITIDTSLVNDGPITLGSGATTVELNKLKAATDFDLVIDGQSAAVKLSPNFNTQTECKK